VPTGQVGYAGWFPGMEGGLAWRDKTQRTMSDPRLTKPRHLILLEFYCMDGSVAMPGERRRGASGPVAHSEQASFCDPRGRDLPLEL